MPKARTLSLSDHHVASVAPAEGLLYNPAWRMLEDADLDALAAELTQFDIVLSDILMPGSLNGLDLAMMLRHQNPGLPVLLMTGYAAQTGQAMASGFQVLAKPVSAASLASAIGKALYAGKGSLSIRT